MPSWRDRFQKWWGTQPEQPRRPVPPPQVPRTPVTGAGVWEALDSWNATRAGMWEHNFGTNPDVLRDKIAQQYFELGYLDRKVGERTRREYRRQFDEYMRNRYGIDFNREFDWEAWRELYGDIA